MKFFEHRTAPLLPRWMFLARLLRHFIWALVIMATALGIGMLGYHYFEGFNWIDALLNSSMLLGGMGPVNPLQSTGGKIFASFYALFSGLVFIVVMGVLLAPVFHRLIHKFHLDLDDDAPQPDEQ